MRPSHHTVGPALPSVSKSAGPCSPRYHARSFQPMTVGSRAGSSATHGSGAGSVSRSSGSTTPGVPSRSTSTAPIAASAARVCPSVQPLHHFRSTTVAGPNAASHRRASSARAGSGSSRGSGAASQECGRLPAPLAARPGSARAAAHDPPLRGEQEEHPGGHAHAPRPLLVRAVVDLLPQPRHGRGQLAGKGLAAGLERLHGLRARVGEPCLAGLGDPALLDELRVAPPLRSCDRLGAGRLHDGGQIERQDEHRAPHADHPQARALLVQRALDLGEGRGAQPCARREDNGRRIGRVQPREPARQLVEVAGPAVQREKVPPR